MLKLAYSIAFVFSKSFFYDISRLSLTKDSIEAGIGIDKLLILFSQILITGAR